jgi:DNA-binding NarL/FixJ family response regulator
MAVAALTDLLSEQEWTSVRQKLGLSTQQAEMVRGLLQAKGDKEIAQSMGISVPTVRTYMSRVFHKLGVEDRIEVVLHVVSCLRSA